jgi:hypothetical protein
LEGGSSVGVDGNSHSNVTSEDGSSGSDEESSGGVWPVGLSPCFVSVHLLIVDGCTEDDSEHSGENSEVKIFSSQERDSTL